MKHTPLIEPHIFDPVTEAQGEGRGVEAVRRVTARGPRKAEVDTQAPEMTLLLAVLERAILDLGGRGQEGGHYRRSVRTHLHEAFEWVTSMQEETWTFLWVCDQLQLEPERARTRLFTMATNLDLNTVRGVRGDWRTVLRTHGCEPGAGA